MKLFGKSVDSVVSKLGKMLDELEQVEEHHEAKALAADERAEAAKREALEASKEAARARRVGANVRQLIGG